MQGIHVLQEEGECSIEQFDSTIYDFEKLFWSKIMLNIKFVPNVFLEIRCIPYFLIHVYLQIYNLYTSMYEGS